MLVTNRDQIINSPTNNSSSKASYSFQKAKRFAEKQSSTSSFYDIPSSFSKRSASFGYGLKSDFTSEKLSTPGPGAYQPVSEKHSKGFSFGLSRDNCKGFVEGAFKADPTIPGPGAYSFTPKFSNEGRKITLTGRDALKKVSDEVPGPGSYNTVQPSSPGKYMVSNFKSQQVYSFPPRSSKFPKDSKDEVPAPGTYDIDKGFLGYSKVLSTCKSSGTIKFGNTERNLKYGVKNTPGPGSYRIPSEFGYYETPLRSENGSIYSMGSKKSGK